jgi:hypothetical protein
VDGDRSLLAQIHAHGAEASAHLAKVVNDAGDVAEGIKQITKNLPPDMVRRLRSNKALTREDIFAVIDSVAVLAREFYAARPDFCGPTLREHQWHSFVFRFALAGQLLAFNWVASGGIESARRSRVANDVVDMNYVAYATFFDGILSSDKKVNEIYRDACLFLENAFVANV